MSNESFDIESLLRFKPARFLCEKCLALLITAPYNGTAKQAVCPHCGVTYLPTEEYQRVSRYLIDKGYHIGLTNLIEHSQELALIAYAFKAALASPSSGLKYPPMRALFNCLLTAKKFVHFITYGMSHMFVGAMKMAAQRIPVRGIISGVDEGLADELTRFPDEAPYLKVNIFERKTRPEKWDSAAPKNHFY